MFLDLGVGNLIEPLTGRRWAPGDTHMRVEARIAAYAAAGFVRGDRAFIHFGNCPEFFAELLAVWMLGGCAIPIDARFTPYEIETLAKWSKPRYSSWLEPPEPALTSALMNLGVHVMQVPRGIEPPKRGGRAPIRGFALDNDALILFTSGTTGQPKGVVHTHRSLRARWMALRDHLGLDAYARTLCTLPTHFGHGLICNALFPWLSGCDLYIMPPFRPDTIARIGTIIDENQITFMSSVPALWRLALRIAKPPQHHSLSRVFIGSAPLSAALWTDIAKWADGARVMNSYGITETGSWLAGTTVGDFTPEDGLIGVAWGGILRTLRSREPWAPLDPSQICRPGESGHVWTLTPALMRGYLDRDDLTEQVVGGGWFATGDIGVIDERGWLVLRGREREEINKGGMKVYPGDVDGVVERFAATLDVCAFAYPDALLGEDVGVAVALKQKDDATLRELYEWSRQHLAAHQIPQRWYVLDEIPRTSRGKVNRSQIAEHCASQRPVDMSIMCAPLDRGQE